MIEAALATARAAGDVTFALAAGAIAFAALLPADGPRARALSIAARAGTGTLLAGLAWIIAEAAMLGDDPPLDALRELPGVVAGTSFGRAWALAWAAQLAGTLLALAGRRARHAWALAGAGAAFALAAIARAGIGHAAAQGLGLAAAAMALHLLATSVWAGSVTAAALVLAGGGLDDGDRARVARRLSRLATIALALVLATGAGSAWHALAASSDLPRTITQGAWGRLLAIKLAGVATAIALGAFNRFVTMPALQRPADADAAWHGFVRVLGVEARVLAAVLVAGALLAGVEPPA